LAGASGPQQGRDKLRQGRLIQRHGIFKSKKAVLEGCSPIPPRLCCKENSFEFNGLYILARIMQGLLTYDLGDAFKPKCGLARRAAKRRLDAFASRATQPARILA
jgi:hypothetical protein